MNDTKAEAHAPLRREIAQDRGGRIKERRS